MCIRDRRYTHVNAAQLLAVYKKAHPRANADTRSGHDRTTPPKKTDG